MTYAAAVLATRDTRRAVQNYVTAFLVEAQSYDEAVGRATRVGEVMYPRTAGWRDHVTSVNARVLTPETAVPETAGRAASC